MTLDDFEKDRTQKVFYEIGDRGGICGKYIHKSLPIELYIYVDMIIPDKEAFIYEWFINDNLVEEFLDDRSPDSIADEELSLYLLKYSQI